MWRVDYLEGVIEIEKEKFNIVFEVGVESGLVWKGSDVYERCIWI